MLREILQWFHPLGDESTEPVKVDAGESKSLIAARDRFFQLYMESAKGGLERAQAGAQAARNAAAAIGVIYTAVLGVAFSVDKLLPPRGLIPAVFLGLAIVMATAYEAYPVQQRTTQYFPEESTKGPLYDAQTYAGSYALWVAARINTKAYALRVAIMSLALGVAALPLGFISLGSEVADPELPPWPDPPTSVVATELATTLYQAQVAEVAAQRRSILQANPGESLDEPGVRAVYVVSAVSLIAIFLHAIPGWIARRAKKASRSR